LNFVWIIVISISLIPNLFRIQEIRASNFSAISATSYAELTGKVKTKVAALPHFTLHPNPAAVQLDKLLGQG
jgi:hypothetical protein